MKLSSFLPPGNGFSRQVLKNSSLNGAKTVILSVITFFTTPIILRHLGIENYAVWTLVIAFASYSNFLELGFNSVVTKMVASRTEPEKEVAKKINSTVLTYAFVSLGLIISSSLLLAPVKELFFKNIRVPNLDIYLLGTLFFFLLNLTTSNFLSVLTGLLRMDLTNLISIAVNVTQALTSIVFLVLGWKLDAVFLGSALSSLLGSFLAVWLAKREYPALFISLKKYNFAEIKNLFSFSLKMSFVNSTGNFLSIANKFLISDWCGLQFVAYYELGLKIINQIRTLFQNLLEPLFPASSALSSLADENRFIRAYGKSRLYLFMVSAIAYSILFLCSYPVVYYWLGKEFTQVSLIIIIIGIGNFVNLQTAAGFFFLASKNDLQLPMVSAVLALVCNFAISALLFTQFGFWGLLVGFAAAQIVSSGWFIFAAEKRIQKPTIT